MSRGGLFGPGGRFSGSVDPVMEKFNASISFDQRMWREDLLGSIAYAKALVGTKIITTEESDQLVKGLEAGEQWESELRWAARLLSTCVWARSRERCSDVRCAAC